MITNIEQKILKELDKQKFDGKFEAFIMSHLDSFDKRNKFFSYLQVNNGRYIDKMEITDELKRINNIIKTNKF